jgi:glycosyltransferase involved in cell wall biosynthesis
VQTLLPNSLRRPYGVFLHAVEAWSPLSSGRRRALVEAKVRVANSHYTARMIAAAHPEVGEIDVCHLTLGLNMRQAPYEAAEPSGGLQQIIGQIYPDSILIVGRIMKSERWKGHDELIGSWPLVMQKVPGAQLVIVGRGDDVPRLRALAWQFGVSRNVLFLGHVDERTLLAIYRRVAAFAMPSRAEGFGMVYLEAMLHRLPCIGSVHDAAREIVVDGETGFLIDQEDTAGLAARIVLLLTDADLRHRLGGNGYERLRINFSFEQFQARMRKLFEKLEA